MFAFARAIVWSSLVVAFGLVFIPARILRWTGATPPASIGFGQIVGIALVLGGGALVVACLYVFAFVGKGTSAPFDPPRRLVAEGPYAYVRNPIYIGAVAAMLGAASYYHSPGILTYAIALAIGFHLLVLFYEEPTLRRSFGAEYEEYLTRVSRWFPKRPRRTVTPRSSG